MDIRPDYANVEQDGVWIRTDPEALPPGTVILVQPGEKVPIDGVVLEGISALDTGALTGESLPRDVHPGSEVLSGCINLSGLLRIRTTRAFGESTVSKILELVENASSSKSRSEKFISRFARVYTPAVCCSALALTILPPVFLLLSGSSPLWTQWLYRALTFLVASCPCALVISIPLTFFAGIGGASRAGILVKGSNYLEALGNSTTVVFDKTGTLTQGVFAVEEIAGEEEQALLRYAAYAESLSSHPIGKSLQAAYGQPIDRSRVAGLQEIGGCGVTACVDGVFVAVGNDKLMDRLGISFTPCHKPGTLVYVGLEGRFAGYIRLCDRIKPTAAQAVTALKAAGISKLVMLTGDSQAAAHQTAAALGIRNVYSQLLPEDKVYRVEQLLACQKKSDRLVFVGDGINDAPVLSRADIGIAMGALGSDAAIEAADVVLMDDDPRKISQAIRLCRKCMAIIRQNIILSLFVKFLALALVGLGAAGMGLAVFADVGVMVLAVLNAIRALKCPPAQ